MKSLAELKRRILPGTRLLCISNTYRPELSGRIRVVCRVQTNAFTWKDEQEIGLTHELVIESLRDIKAKCTCGLWSLVSPAPDSEADESLRARTREEFDRHKYRIERESWTNFEKAALYTFGENDTFTFGLGMPGIAGSREGHTVTLQILPASEEEKQHHPRCASNLDDPCDCENLRLGDAVVHAAQEVSRA